MFINYIKSKNFRSLIDAELILDESKRQELSLILGKNNSGKTSFIMLFDKFLRSEVNFDFNDFPLSLRKTILEIDDNTDISITSIALYLTITYGDDNLEYLADFITDLNPVKNEVKLYLECSIEKESLLRDLKTIEEDYKKKFIEKTLHHYLIKNIYIYNELDELNNSKEQLVQKEISELKKIINYQVIHAKRNLASSESNIAGNLPISRLSSDYFNKENKFTEDKFKDINNAILKMDSELSKAYKLHFEDYFNTVNDFLGDATLNILSNLESKQILSNFSKIVYGSDSESFLPESLNGLGHLNILFLLLQIEVKKKYFEQEKKDINLLFIEEPEAHTHPQMQYIFAKKIKKIISDIPNIQAFITTHSSHIVSQCDFRDIRYFKNCGLDGIKIKNFYSDLEKKYSSTPEHFKFLKQYITLNSSELFFAEKIIFIEGLSERLLIPLFIKYFDDGYTDPNYIPISSKNISTIETGANAKVFEHLIDFLQLQTVVITDIDSTKQNDNGRWVACEVSKGKNISNETIKHYLKHKEFIKVDSIPSKKRKTREQLLIEQKKLAENWFKEIVNNKIETESTYIKIAYQTEENGYQARSFEDAFIAINKDLIIKHGDEILGLKEVESLNSPAVNIYQYTNDNLESKSDFASSILFLALSKDIKWNTPKYINEALKWISE